MSMIRMTAEDWLRQDVNEIFTVATQMLNEKISAKKYDKKIAELVARMRKLAVGKIIEMSMGGD